MQYWSFAWGSHNKPRFQIISHQEKVDSEFRWWVNKVRNFRAWGEASGTYYEAKATWWLFRNQITKGIDASFGIMGSKTTFKMILHSLFDGKI